MVNIIDGKKIAERIKDEVVAEIVAINDGDAAGPKRPGLAIMLVGNREDSEIYVGLKEKEAKKCGIDIHLYKFEEDAPEEDVKNTILFLNNDESIDAILIQLPLPKKFDTDTIIRLMDPKKDVDRFHPENIKKLLDNCNNEDVMPPLYQVITEIIDDADYNMIDKEVCVVANSDIFGDNLAHVLKCQKVKNVVITKGDDPKLEEKTSKADILITAVGKREFIKAEYIKEDAFIIDIGITKDEGKIYGDVDYYDVEDKAGWLTPVPGGVGPITIATALRNAVELYKKYKCNK